MLFKNRDQIIGNGQTPELKKIRREILEILTSAYHAVDPYNAVKNHIIDGNIVFKKKTVDISKFDNIYLIGFGKASIRMAQAICDSLYIKNGIVITNESKKKVQYNNITTYTGNHPIPSQNNIEKTEKILSIVRKCRENDLLIALISGGGSALLCKPRVSLNDLKHTTDLLLKSGANIKEINTIRKHLSFIKGGQLVSFAKCRIISFISSDIIGDPIEFIASGPTYPDSTTYAEAQNISKKYKIWMKLPYSVRKIIKDGIQGKIPETPKKKTSFFQNVNNYIIANNQIACEAAMIKAKEIGYKTILITTSLSGEAKTIGKYLVEKATNFFTNSKKMIFISGGETTVTIKGEGKGGRNQEMVLSSIESLANKNIIFSSFATDGIDGNCDAAGAIADGYTLKRSFKQDMDQKRYLEDNNSYEFFKNLGDLFITGPTGTNVMDIQIIAKIR